MICREKTACFTGHREIKENYNVLFLKVYNVVENLIKKGYLYFGSGGARGFDALASEVVLKLKKKYPNIHLILVLPFLNQYEKEKGWSREEIYKYKNIKENASKVVYTQKNYSTGCYYKRNRHLVDFSSVCICYMYKMSGGTAYTVQYAGMQSLIIINCF